MIKTNIKMRVTPEQFRRVQEICFENGINWINGSNEIKDNYEFLFILSDYGTTYTIDNQVYFEKELKEIDADLFIKTNGTCEETYLTKYTSQPKDLESALKKIENLHIALNKKRDKNKNQALEITKLLEQKEEYKQNIDMVLKALNTALNTALKELTAKNEELQSNLDYKNESVKQLINDKENLKNKAVSLEQQLKNQMINMKEILKQLEEKDTIISYLESKLK